jgi:hypothetical protein
VRRDWWGRALSALIGIWVAGMIATPAGSRVSHRVDLSRALRAVPDRTWAISAREAPDSDPTPPARTVARECSNACGEGGRRVADGVPTASIVEIATLTQVRRVELPTAPRRRHASDAHTLPPALGPPSSLV